MSNLKQQKDLIRNKIIKLRLELSDDQIAIDSAMIALKLQKIDCFRIAKGVLLYMPIKNEVETKYMLSLLEKSKKHVFLPAFSNSGWIISKFKIDENLISGPFDIKQPKKISRGHISDCDIAIIPGIVFSDDGVRVGYGKGVYDRLLKNTDCLKIGLCYDFQIVKYLKPKPNDVPMDIVISEKRIIRRQNLLFSNK